MTQDTAQTDRPAPLRKRAERAAGRIGLNLIVRPLRALPLPAVRAFGRGLGWLLFHTLGRYRRVALKNLNLVYGREWDERKRRQMALDVFRNFGETATEFLKLPQMSREEADSLVTVIGEENLRQAFAAGRGVLIISGHFGNWEFMSRWLTLHDYPLNVVARRANDPKADKLLTDTRSGSGAQVHNRGNAARAVLQCLKKKEAVGLLPDQNAGDVFTPFLGVRTGTVDGPAIIHLKTGAPLLFGWCVRLPDDRFELTFEPPYVCEPTGDKNRDIETVMAQVNARLEAQIRKRPAQWLWLHDRWKHTPEVFQQAPAPQGERNPA